MFKQLFASWKVWGHGLLLAVLGAVLAAAEPMLHASTLPGMNEIQTVLCIGLAAGLSYLVKNVLSQGTPNGSSLFSLGAVDIGYMIFQVILSGIFTSVIALLAAHQLPTLAQLWTIVLGAFGNGLTYLVKNFVTNSQGKLAPEPAPK